VLRYIVTYYVWICLVVCFVFFGSLCLCFSCKFMFGCFAWLRFVWLGFYGYFGTLVVCWLLLLVCWLEYVACVVCLRLFVL